MVKRCILTVLLVFFTHILLSQCIERGKIQEGYIIGQERSNKITYSPVYVFYSNGKDYDFRIHNLFEDAIDKKQAGSKAKSYQQQADNAIKTYSGNRFFSNLRLNNITIFYPERDEYPIDNEHRKIDTLYKNIMYNYILVYEYEFRVDSLSWCTFRIEVDKSGRVNKADRNYYFPSKLQYHPIDKHFSYCKLIEISRKFQKHIDPIKSIEFCYNINKKGFSWIISQAVGDSAPGTYPYNYVEIDASDLSKAVKRRGNYCIGIPES